MKFRYVRLLPALAGFIEFFLALQGFLDFEGSTISVGILLGIRHQLEAVTLRARAKGQLVCQPDRDFILDDI